MDLSKDGTDLCLICEQLDFQSLLGAYIGAEERTSRSTMLETGICLGPVAELHERSYCRICSLVFEMLQTLRPDGRIPLEKDGQQIVCYLNNLVRDCTGLQLDASKALDTSRPFAFQLLITTQPPLVEQYEEEPQQDLPPPLLIQRLSEEVTLENSCYGRKLPTSSIDFNLLSHWIETCARKTAEESRMDSVAKPKQPKLSLRLIDVIHQSLIGPIEAPEYIALSYMWGKITPFTLIRANLSDLQKNRALSTNDLIIPQTIRDAMDVCRRLGERYLWVDSLCIVQDAKDKHDEIGQMDKIYQRAKMTIVAAYGTGADAGLLGVRPASRLSSQRVVDVQGMKLSSVLPGLGNAVDATPWNTRAWTYQERLLSNRKLYFCKDQVFFECDHGQYREDMLIDPHSNAQLREVTYGTDPKHGTAHKIVYRNKLNLHVYEEIVFEYTSRNLSYEEDIMNAFQGVSNVLSRCHSHESYRA